MTQLIFVYNADSSLFSSITDYVHKIISPKTYQCNLCALTYGNFGMKKEWKFFLENLDIKVSFLHRDEFVQLYPKKSKIQLPCIYLKLGKKMKLFVSSQELDKQKTVKELMCIIENRL